MGEVLEILKRLEDKVDRACVRIEIIEKDVKELKRRMDYVEQDIK